MAKRVTTGEVDEASKATATSIVLGRKVGDVWTLVGESQRIDGDRAVYVD